MQLGKHQRLTLVDRMYSTLLLMAICLAPCVASYDLVAKKDNADVISLMKNGFQVVVRAITDYFWTLPPWVKKCIVEFSCFFEKNPNFSKCAMYVVKCAAGELLKMASCLYDIVGDLSINYLYEGWGYLNYDFGRLIFDIFACAGLDFNAIMNMVRPYFVKN